jgi:2-polyprenyl-3-methyl-5-hydroxy-6-metoxy-1,4-benzoquinol methylase
MKDPGEKVTQETWDKRHQILKLKANYPRPHLYYLDYELDRIFQKYLKDLVRKNILEIGCGASVWLPYFVWQFGMKVAGIDYSPVGIELCRQNLKAHGVEEQLVQADVFKMGTEWYSQFHVVFSLGLIEHFEDPRVAVEVFQKFLLPGGLMISWIPNQESVILKLSHFLKKDLKDFYGVLPPDHFIKIHEEFGLEVLESRYIQFNDFMLVNLERFPGFVQKTMARLFRGIGWGMIFLSKKTGFHPRTKSWSAGFVVVARKLGGQD